MMIGERNDDVIGRGVVKLHNKDDINIAYFQCGYFTPYLPKFVLKKNVCSRIKILENRVRNFKKYRRKGNKICLIVLFSSASVI